MPKDTACPPSDTEQQNPAGHCGPVFTFRRMAGLDQALLSTDAEWQDLRQLDPKLWMAMSCPTYGLEFDAQTLTLLDADSDGRIRAREILDAVDWLCQRVSHPSRLRERRAKLPLDILRQDTPEGVDMLAAARDQMDPGGVMCLTVPNDFSPLQIAAQDGKGHAPWWIAPPHHLNYFDFDSLEALLTRLGLKPVDRLTSFPMEAFLLMGDDYVADPATGKACHRRRMNFDLAFEAAGIGDVRRRLYGALAAAGIGREATVIAVKP